MKINHRKLKDLLQLIAAGIFYFILVFTTEFSIPCPIKKFTHGHLLCPGCGATRMCRSLLKLNFSEAFHWNPIVFCLMPLWGICAVLWLFDKGEKFIKTVEVVSIVIMLIFGVVRNLPVWKWY